MSRYVGVDLHRRRSVVVILDEDGTRVSLRRIENSPLALVEAVGEAGFGVHLAHPLGIGGYRNRRVRNDERDAMLLADLLRMGSLPEGWIAPPKLRWCGIATNCRSCGPG